MQPAPFLHKDKRSQQQPKLNVSNLRSEKSFSLFKPGKFSTVLEQQVGSGGKLKEKIINGKVEIFITQEKQDEIISICVQNHYGDPFKVPKWLPHEIIIDRPQGYSIGYFITNEQLYQIHKIVKEPYKTNDLIGDKKITFSQDGIRSLEMSLFPPFHNTQPQGTPTEYSIVLTEYDEKTDQYHVVLDSGIEQKTFHIASNTFNKINAQIQQEISANLVTSEDRAINIAPSQETKNVLLQFSESSQYRLLAKLILEKKDVVTSVNENFNQLPQHSIYSICAITTESIYGIMQPYKLFCQEDKKKKHEPKKIFIIPALLENVHNLIKEDKQALLTVYYNEVERMEIVLDCNETTKSLVEKKFTIKPSNKPSKPKIHIWENIITRVIVPELPSAFENPAFSIKTVKKEKDGYRLVLERENIDESRFEWEIPTDIKTLLKIYHLLSDNTKIQITKKGSKHNSFENLIIERIPDTKGIPNPNKDLVGLKSALSIK